jgi:hypothetical protein
MCHGSRSGLESRPALDVIVGVVGNCRGGVEGVLPTSVESTRAWGGRLRNRYCVRYGTYSADGAGDLCDRVRHICRVALSCDEIRLA